MKSHFMSNHLFRLACRLSNNVEKNMVQPDRTHNNIIQRMRFVFGITTTTDTHNEDI
jgi:hypothetical protein